MNEVRMISRAKINISLDVVRKRSDGYHDLSMIMQTINLYDKVNLRIVKSKGIVIETNLPFLPVDQRNLVYRIIEYMLEIYDISEGIYVDLYKMIPIAAGLAGGSANAAATIKGMNLLFDLKLSLQEMIGIGKLFGADIPYCLVEGTVLAEGIGDVMTLLPDFPECNIVIVKPNIGVSTAAAFGKLQTQKILKRPNNNLLIEAIEKKDLITISQNMVNVLEEVSIQDYQEIEIIKNQLMNHGALGALMSGSGSAVFGIFNSTEAADQAASMMKKIDFVKFVYSTNIYNRG